MKYNTNKLRPILHYVQYIVVESADDSSTERRMAFFACHVCAIVDLKIDVWTEWVVSREDVLMKRFEVVMIMKSSCSKAMITKK